MNEYEIEAGRLAEQVRASGEGFVTLRREELRALFGMGRITSGLAEQVVGALESHGLMVFPDPSVRCSTVRVYDLEHPMGRVAQSVLWPEETTDAPLRRVAKLQERVKAGRDLRSEDVGWLEAFDLLLQLSCGREPEGWEELRDDRHGLMLARELAEAMGLEASLAEARWFVRAAAAVCAGRPRGRQVGMEDFGSAHGGVEAGAGLVEALRRRDECLREAQQEVVRAAARLVLGEAEMPAGRIELGVLGLRRRHEDEV